MKLEVIAKSKQNALTRNGCLWSFFHPQPQPVPQSPSVLIAWLRQLTLQAKMYPLFGQAWVATPRWSGWWQGSEGRSPKPKTGRGPLGSQQAVEAPQSSANTPQWRGASREQGWGTALATRDWQDTAQQLKLLHLKKTQGTHQVPYPIILFLCS